MSFIRREGYDEKRARIAAEMADRARGIWVDQRMRQDPWRHAMRVNLPLNTPFPWIHWETPA